MHNSKRRILVCVGAPKCGTTWLYEQSKNAAQYFNYPYKKEVDFWNCYKHSEESSNVFNGAMPRFLKRILGRIKHHNVDSNYDNPDRGKLYIDFSPSYMSLSLTQLEDIRQVAPDSKFILCTRNPVERIRSHYKYALRLKRNAYLKYIPGFYHQTKKCKISTGYKEIHEKITSVFGDSNVLVLRYESMFSNPRELERVMSEFTGVPWKVSGDKVINKTDNIEADLGDRTISNLYLAYEEQIKFWEKYSDI